MNKTRQISWSPVWVEFCIVIIKKIHTPPFGDTGYTFWLAFLIVSSFPLIYNTLEWIINRYVCNRINEHFKSKNQKPFTDDVDSIERINERAVSVSITCEITHLCMHTFSSYAPKLMCETNIQKWRKKKKQTTHLAHILLVLATSNFEHLSDVHVYIFFSNSMALWCSYI